MKNLLKVINILGYLSILALLYFALLFLMTFHSVVKVLSIIALIIMIFLNVAHYKKTSIKYFGIRILVTIIILFLVGMCGRIVFGRIMNAKSEKLGSSIEKVVYTNDEGEEETLDIDSISFINTPNPIIKSGKSDAIIYYKDGRTENTIVYEFEQLIYIGNYPYRF